MIKAKLTLQANEEDGGEGCHNGGVRLDTDENLEIQSDREIPNHEVFIISNIRKLVSKAMQ